MGARTLQVIANLSIQITQSVGISPLRSRTPTWLERAGLTLKLQPWRSTGLCIPCGTSSRKIYPVIIALCSGIMQPGTHVHTTRTILFSIQAGDSSSHTTTSHLGVLVQTRVAALLAADTLVKSSGTVQM